MPVRCCNTLDLCFTAGDQEDFEIAGSQSDLNIDEDHSPVPEGLKFYKPPLRRTPKKKKEPQSKSGAIMVP